MTRIMPRRRTILQCSQSFFTDARTFIFRFSFRPKFALTTNRRASIATLLFHPAQMVRQFSVFDRRWTQSPGGHWPIPRNTFRWPAPRLRHLQPGRHPFRACQNLRLTLGYQNRMLKMGREWTILCNNCPVVFQDFYARLTRHNHRFDGNRHSRP